MLIKTEARRLTEAEGWKVSEADVIELAVVGHVGAMEAQRQREKSLNQVIDVVVDAVVTGNGLPAPTKPRLATRTEAVVDRQFSWTAVKAEGEEVNPGDEIMEGWSATLRDCVEFDIRRGIDEHAISWQTVRNMINLHRESPCIPWRAYPSEPLTDSEWSSIVTDLVQSVPQVGE